MLATFFSVKVAQKGKFWFCHTASRINWRAILIVEPQCIKMATNMTYLSIRVWMIVLQMLLSLFQSLKFSSCDFVKEYKAWSLFLRLCLFELACWPRERLTFQCDPGSKLKGVRTCWHHRSMRLSSLTPNRLSSL